MKKLFSVTAAASLIPVEALAHPGHGAFSFLAGLQHPFTGTDHLLAILAVGLLAAMKGGRAVWLWPLSFFAFLVVGAAAVPFGYALPFPDPLAGLTVLILGLGVALVVEVPVVIGAIIAALVAFCHGNAHGFDASAASALTFVGGVVAASAILYGAGLGLGRLLYTSSLIPVMRIAGTGIASAGVLFFLT